MRRLIVITDAEPNVKHFWNSWEFRSGRIEGEIFTIEMRDKTTLEVEAIDPQMVADIVFSHDPTSEIVTGKLGIKKVTHSKPTKSASDATADFVKALRELLREVDD